VPLATQALRAARAVSFILNSLRAVADIFQPLDKDRQVLDRDKQVPLARDRPVPPTSKEPALLVDRARLVLLLVCDVSVNS